MFLTYAIRIERQNIMEEIEEFEINLDNVHIPSLDELSYQIKKSSSFLKF